MAYPGKKITELNATTSINDSSLIPVVVTPGVSLETNKITIANAKSILKGDKGDKGDTGSAATLDVGSTSTGNPGTDASVINSGTTSAAIFDFTIPRGDVGANGPQGIQGETGASIVSGDFVGDNLVFTKDDTTTVSIVDAKTDLKGDQGIQGIQGIKGDPGLGITEQSIGFTLTGGTTPKTLTVALDASVSGSNTGDQTLPVKATGAELDTGTDDAKFATAKAIKDAHNVPSVAPGTSGNVLKSNGTDWTSAAPSASVSVTTKGDLQTFNSTVPDRLGVGTDGQILESRASEDTGLKWITPSFDSIVFTFIPGTDHTSSGVKTRMVANENQVLGDVCYLDIDEEAHIGDADAIATSRIMFMCADQTISANATGNYLRLGSIRDESWSWNQGPIYLSTTGTSGNTITQTPPTGVDDCVVYLGEAINSFVIHFAPEPGSIIERT